MELVMLVVQEAAVSAQNQLGEMIENFPVEFVFAAMAVKLVVSVLAELEDMIDK